MSGETPVPLAVVMLVENYVTSELADAEKYDNRAPLDDSGVWSLHRMVAEAYAVGFSDGVNVESGRDRAIRQRARARARDGATT